MTWAEVSAELLHCNKSPLTFSHTGLSWKPPLFAAVARSRREQTLRSGHRPPRHDSHSAATAQQHPHCKQRGMFGYPTNWKKVLSSQICCWHCVYTEHVKSKSFIQSFIQLDARNSYYFCWLWSAGSAKGAAGQAGSSGLPSDSVVSASAWRRHRGEQRGPGETPRDGEQAEAAP